MLGFALVTVSACLSFIFLKADFTGRVNIPSYRRRSISAGASRDSFELCKSDTKFLPPSILYFHLHFSFFELSPLRDKRGVTTETYRRNDTAVCRRTGTIGTTLVAVPTNISSRFSNSKLDHVVSTVSDGCAPAGDPAKTFRLYERVSDSKKLELKKQIREDVAPPAGAGASEL
ncbi:hypothetical protein EVAR_93207_1 [Eumeta japonica]|uniref:Uncharacterized protein n=1 Tax=Eumeta variegata TaxID=151549 RepID=A0A4C1TXL0_EUMVA|nr:hypothetical protein EVAR_93207_1 [Eumeta japonica]